jgi:hypothetical protein
LIKRPLEAARMIQSPDSTNSQGWRSADYARFEASWAAAISAGDIAALRRIAADPSLPWHEQCDDVIAMLDTMLDPPPAVRKPRRPTLASIARQANRAAIAVARYEIKPDGTIVIVTGQGESTELENPWLAELPKETKQ